MSPSALGAEPENYLCRLLEKGSQGGSAARAEPGAAIDDGRGGHNGDPRPDVRSPAAPPAEGTHGADLRLQPGAPEASGSDDPPALADAHGRGDQVHNGARQRGPPHAVYPYQRDQSSSTSAQDQRGTYPKPSSATSPGPSMVQRIAELDAADKEAP